MALPLRYRLAVLLVGLNVISIGVLARFAYNASRESLEEQARIAVGETAEARREALVRSLESQQRRLSGFLESAVSLCGERGPNGRLGLELECVHVALSGLADAEHATAVELRYRGRRIAGRGGWTTAPSAVDPRQLAIARANENGAEYTMAAARRGLILRARFLRRDLEHVFDDRSGLGERGDVQLLDAAGDLLTRAGPRAAGAATEIVSRCLAGESGEVIATDDGGVPVVAGFRAVPAIGGGCVVAQRRYSDVLVPINRLGRTFLYASAGFILLGVALAFLVSHAVAKPISRLAAAARAMQSGQFEAPAPVGGPAEVRALHRTFSHMTTAIGDLVRREQAARVDAEKASRLKDDFLATISHELRTPLNAILGWASIASRGSAHDALSAQALRAIERSARTQARLVDDLLDVSRIASGRMRLNRAAVSLVSVIDAAIETVRPAADAKAITIVRDIEGPTCTVAGDAQRLQQSVWNLLSNAVRFTPERGRVDVRLRGRDGQAELQVADTGHGIDADFLPHVFEPFRQADSGATRRHGGLGLGLAIVRQLIELHGGTVGVESEGRGRGTTFTIRLPLRPETATTPRVADLSNAPAGSPTLDGTRVIVVDDDPDAREIVRTVLESAGARVTTAASAEETRAILDAVHPDLVIADIGMPGEDGYSLMRSIRRRPADVGATPAIALTAHAQREDVERALAAGFQVHIAKPIDPPHLVAMAATLVHADQPGSGPH